MSRGRLRRRFPVLGIRDFRLLLADRLIAPASVGFSLVGVSFAVLKATGSASDLSYVLAAQIAPALFGLLVAAAGAGWALVLCGIGMVVTVPMLLSIQGSPVPAPVPARVPVQAQAQALVPAHAAVPAQAPPAGMLAELREGWSEFRSHTWLWVIVAQFCIVLMAWYGAFSVLGPVVAREHLGGPAAWGAITAADAFGLIAGGLMSLRFTPRRPMLFVVLAGGAIAISPLSLAMVLPLAAICVASFGLGVLVEMMMVQWTVAMTRNIPPDKLARVSSYDVLGSVMAMPAGALIAGPLGTAIGISRAQYAAAAVIIVATRAAEQPERRGPINPCGTRRSGLRLRRSSGTSGTSPRRRLRTPPRGAAGRRSAPRSRPSRDGRRARCGRSAPPS